MRQVPKAPRETNESMMAKLIDSEIKDKPLIDLFNRLQAEKKRRQFEAYRTAGFTPEQAFELCKIVEK